MEIKIQVRKNVYRRANFCVKWYDNDIGVISKRAKIMHYTDRTRWDSVTYDDPDKNLRTSTWYENIETPSMARHWKQPVIYLWK